MCVRVYLDHDDDWQSIVQLDMGRPLGTNRPPKVDGNHSVVTSNMYMGDGEARV